MSQSALALAPTITVIDGKPTTLSTDVARHFGKRHDHILRDIDNLRVQLNAEHLPNFGETVETRPNPSGGALIESRAYRLTRDGFTLLAMGFTGKKALQFKLAYIDAFNKMESQLTGAAKGKGMDIAQAMEAANLIAAQVQKHVFEQLLEEGEWAHERWLLSFGYSKDQSTPQCKKIENNSYVLPLARFHAGIHNAMTPDPATLAKISKACTDRLEHMAAHCKPTNTKLTSQ